jgi:hypothetical protein
VVVLLIAPAASALSSITYSLTFNPRNFCGNDRVVVKADGTFGWSWEPNPYYSNYRVAIHWRHFYRPSIWSNDTEGTAYYYVAADDWLELAGDPPSWRFDSGTFLVIPTQYRHTYADAYGRTKADGGVRGSLRNKMHYYWTPILPSWGAKEFVYTDHC